MIALTTGAIKLMKHFVGLDHSEPKRGKYKAYRNYFDGALKNNAHWDLLVKHNLIKEVEKDFFVLTEEGIHFLEESLDIKITIMK